MKSSKMVAITMGAALVLLFSGCAPGSTTTDPQPSSSQQSPGDSSGPAITIENFAFQGPTSVGPGATVTITNMDSSSHTVTSDDGSSFAVTVESGGGTGTFTAPTQPGTYPYHCGFHPSMHGTLIVK